jgi:hypothetical protein
MQFIAADSLKLRNTDATRKLFEGRQPKRFAQG